MVPVRLASHSVCGWCILHQVLLHEHYCAHVGSLLVLVYLLGLPLEAIIDIVLNPLFGLILQHLKLGEIQPLRQQTCCSQILINRRCHGGVLALDELPSSSLQDLFDIVGIRFEVLRNWRWSLSLWWSTSSNHALEILMFRYTYIIYQKICVRDALSEQAIWCRHQVEWVVLPE